MRKVTTCFTACLITFAIGLSALQVDAQDNTSQKTTASTSVETQHRKNGVELMLEEAHKRGETIMAACLDKCGESTNGKTADGLEISNALELPQPEYPAIARMAHASGEVRVQVIVDVDGKVIAATAISGHPLLQAAAVTAARDAVFTPMKLNGNAVKVVGVIVYNFVL